MQPASPRSQRQGSRPDLETQSVGSDELSGTHEPVYGQGSKMLCPRQPCTLLGTIKDFSMMPSLIVVLRCHIQHPRVRDETLEKRPTSEVQPLCCLLKLPLTQNLSSPCHSVPASVRNKMRTIGGDKTFPLKQKALYPIHPPT